MFHRLLPIRRLPHDSTATTAVAQRYTDQRDQPELPLVLAPTSLEQYGLPGVMRLFGFEQSRTVDGILEGSAAKS